MPSYSIAFVVGWKNKKKMAIEDHAKSKPHMKAYQFYLHSQVVPLEKTAKSFSSNLGNESIVCGFFKNSFVAMNELPFNKI